MFISKKCVFSFCETKNKKFKIYQNLSILYFLFFLCITWSNYRHKHISSSTLSSWIKWTPCVWMSLKYQRFNNFNFSRISYSPCNWISKIFYFLWFLKDMMWFSKPSQIHSNISVLHLFLLMFLYILKHCHSTQKPGNNQYLFFYICICLMIRVRAFCVFFCTGFWYVINTVVV